MRKLFSILFIALILFNISGYYAVFLGLQYKNERELTEKFDTESYGDSETITIKIPIAIPYASESTEFERVDGEFEHNGEYYRLIKQLFSQDTLYVVCLKDIQSKRINKAMGDYIKTFTGKPGNTPETNTFNDSIIKDYIAQAFSISHLSSGWQRDVTENSFVCTLIPDFYPSIIHPPEQI